MGPCISALEFRVARLCYDNPLRRNASFLSAIRSGIEKRFLPLNKIGKFGL